MSTPFEEAAARVRAGGDHHAEAAALVAQMTIDERLGCLDGDTPFWPGLIDMTAGGYYRHPWPAAHVERLGVPGIDFADGPRGCVVGDATAFPVSMARGASFDPDLETRIGDAIGAELRASGATYTGAVCMNLLRHPAWGRAQETYGEDPHHVGVMASAFVAGLQRHVMACMKHFALNSMENARFTVDVTADERALHEVYLPHFERVAAGGVASVMSAYNSVNGEWCGQNAHLLTEILRDEWGWDGFVTSDFIFGLRDPVASVTAGLDIEMPFRQQRAMALADAVADGTLAQARRRPVGRADRRHPPAVLDGVRTTAAGRRGRLRRPSRARPGGGGCLDGGVAQRGRAAAAGGGDGRPGGGARTLGGGAESRRRRLERRALVERRHRTRRDPRAVRRGPRRSFRRRRLHRGRCRRGRRGGRLHEGRRRRVHRGGRGRCARSVGLPAGRPPGPRDRRAVDGAARPAAAAGSPDRRWRGSSWRPAATGPRCGCRPPTRR